jgi:hypothetical protein
MVDHDRLMIDLAKATLARVHKAIDLTSQLLDDDEDEAGILMVVAADLIVNAADLLYRRDENDDITEDQALSKVLKAIFATIGMQKIKAAISSPERGK